MRTADTAFTGGPLDGRVLPVPTGLNGRPPAYYEVPVPGPTGARETVHVYRLEAASLSPRLGLPRGWRYVYEPDGRPRPGARLRLPWGRRPL